MVSAGGCVPDSVFWSVISVVVGRLFGAKCDKCGRMFEKTDMVMRARTKIYHLDCFR